MVAVGSWVGTGAGTGVKLNKKGEADGPLKILVGRAGAAEGKKGAGEAAAAQANSI